MLNISRKKKTKKKKEKRRKYLTKMRRKQRHKGMSICWSKSQNGAYNLLTCDRRVFIKIKGRTIFLFSTGISSGPTLGPLPRPIILRHVEESPSFFTARTHPSCTCLYLFAPHINSKSPKFIIKIRALH